MSKLVKDLITEDLKTRYADCENAVYVEYLGVDGKTNTEFRGDLNKHQMKIEVVKNSLFRRAVADSPLAKLADRFDGPSAIITGGESPIHIAKLLEDEWQDKIKSLKLRGALLEGELIDESRVEKLADMPTKEDLHAMIAACIVSPGAKLAGGVASAGAKIAACVNVVVQKKEDGEEIAA